MRQDYALRYEGTKVRDEYTPLVKLAALGLAVRARCCSKPRTPSSAALHLGRTAARNTARFIFRMRTPCPGAFAELAPLLAQLHRVPRVSWAFRLELLLRIVCCS